MKRYCILQRIPREAHAGSKARLDIEAIALEAGYTPFTFRGAATAERRFFKKLLLLVCAVCNWLRLLCAAEKGALVLLQYPHYPYKSMYVAGAFLPLLQRIKHIRFAALVHDLNALRGLGGRAAAYADNRLLPRMDFVICHNGRMAALLERAGVAREKLVPLGLFDYLSSAPAAGEIAYTGQKAICVAGNLSPEKAGYLYQPLPLGTDVCLHLFGIGFDRARCANDVAYHGSFPPDALTGELGRMHFGLVWDGDSADTCAGVYGEYLRINNPHKASLYLSCGVPLIVWSGSANADFVLENGLGLAVESLSGLGAALSGITQQEYRGMRIRAARAAQMLQSGWYFRHSLMKVEEMCSVK